MHRSFHHFCLCVIGSSLLAACGTAEKRRDVWEMYDIHRSTGGQIQGQPIPRDNDSYYTQPGSYNCNTIGDAPSCSGGG